MASIPRERASWQIAFTGKICPDRFVMWQKWITRVFGVMALANMSTRKSIDGGGSGNETFLRTIPSRRTRCSQVVSMRP